MQVTVFIHKVFKQTEYSNTPWLFDLVYIIKFVFTITSLWCKSELLSSGTLTSYIQVQVQVLFRRMHWYQSFSFPWATLLLTQPSIMSSSANLILNGKFHLLLKKYRLITFCCLDSSIIPALLAVLHLVRQPDVTQACFRLCPLPTAKNRQH